MHRYITIAAGAACTTILLQTTMLAAHLSNDAAPVVVRAEEDWELILCDPDPKTGSPQVMCQMRPIAGNDNLYAVLCLNYQDSDMFVENGLELQMWDGSSLVDDYGIDNEPLSTEAEVIRWTQALTIQGGQIYFDIISGSSTTFGAFGGKGFRVSAVTGLSDLGRYDPVDSAKNSGITLGANRVFMLRCLRVRYHMSNNTVVTQERELKAYYIVGSDSPSGDAPASLSQSNSESSDSAMQSESEAMEGTSTDKTVTKSEATLGGASY